MCVIVDANRRDDFFSAAPSPAAQLIRDWIQSGKGNLVVGGKLTEELCGAAFARREITEWLKSGRARRADQERYEQATKEVDALALRSDDAHIIALARATGARTLFTADGRSKGALMGDFRDTNLVPKPKGRIFQSVKHFALLTHTRGCLGQH